MLDSFLNKIIKTAQKEILDKPIKGLILVFEGLDGSGKSTQTELVAKIFKKIGKEVIISRWNSSKKISDVVKFLKNKKDLKPQTWTLLEAADLYERLRKDILPVVQNGGVAILDRYYYTALVRGCIRGADPEWINEIYKYVPEPDYIFYFRINPIISLSRVLKRSKELSISDIFDINEVLKFYESGQDLSFHENKLVNFYFFQKKMTELYDTIFKEYKDKVCVLDASKDILSVYGDIIKFLRNEKVLTGFRTFRDMIYFVELPKGSLKVSKENEVMMPCNYGFIPNTIGEDLMEVDVLVGDNENSDLVVKLYHYNKKDEFSEVKYAIGFSSVEEVIKAYTQIYPNRKMKYGIMKFEDFKKEINKEDDFRSIENLLKSYIGEGTYGL